MEYTRPLWVDLKEGQNFIYVNLDSAKEKASVYDLKTAVLVKKNDLRENQYGQTVMDILVAINGRKENIICEVLAFKEYYNGTDFSMYTSIEGAISYEF